LPLHRLAAQATTPPEHPFAPRPALSLSAGVSQFDLSGTGTMAVVAVRGEVPLARVLLLEGGLAMARPQEDFGVHSTLLMPEGQLQLQIPRRVAPYLGVGAGLATTFRNAADGGSESHLTLSGAAGVRVALNRAFGLRAELRVREFGLRFTGTTADWTLGAAWRF
ncbi:MAG TPA: outer membrane beta-barrel protein, partial [Gemmatimonadaceae bacterium]